LSEKENESLYVPGDLIPATSARGPESGLQAPELVVRDFDLHNPKSLAQTCADLLARAPEGLKGSSTLELVFGDADTHLRLRFDATEWVKQLQAEVRLEHGRAWVRTLESRVAASKPIAGFDETAASVDETCSHPFCRTTGCKKDHKALTCLAMINRRGVSQKTTCSDQICSELLVSFPDKMHNSPFFCLQADRECVRKLLLIPTPVRVENKWPGHVNNENVICMPLFWRTVSLYIQQLQTLTGSSTNPLEMIAVNLGGWETAISKDPRLYECHGHAHLILRSDAWRELKAKPGFKVLRGRFHNPTNYTEKEISSLNSQLATFGFFDIHDAVNHPEHGNKALGTTVKENQTTMKEMQTTLNRLIEALCQVIPAFQPAFLATGAPQATVAPTAPAVPPALGVAPPATAAALAPAAPPEHATAAPVADTSIPAG